MRLHLLMLRESNEPVVREGLAAQLLCCRCLFPKLYELQFQDEKRNTDDHGSEFSKEVGGKEQEMAAIEAEEEAERQREDMPALKCHNPVRCSSSFPQKMKLESNPCRSNISAHPRAKQRDETGLQDQGSLHERRVKRDRKTFGFMRLDFIRILRSASGGTEWNGSE